MKKNFYEFLRNPQKPNKLFFGLTVLFGSCLIGNAQPGYITGDFHQHTTYTDGSYTFDHIMGKNNEYGLDWWANSEHGGYRDRDGRVSGIDADTTIYWDMQNDVAILGDTVYRGSHQAMWRWQILRDYSFNSVLKARKTYPKKVIIQGLEWNPPGHEHASVGIITGQFGENPNANAVAEFEYKFDRSDYDISGGAANGWEKCTLEGHEKTLEAISWLQENHQYTSWVVPAHPERADRYKINDFRDMNNAGPDVCFGFESMPGHQKSSNRGGYRTYTPGGGTYGGCGYFAAKIGGMWDAMLSEGRNWWLFASSDFHSLGGDFYPGEYQKTYTYVRERRNANAIVDGLRSGNSWVVEGDLIDYLKFRAYGKVSANMGETAQPRKGKIWIKVIVNDPNTENHFGNNPKLDHIDLIMGEVNGLIDPDDSAYTEDEVSTTKVIARFDATGGVTDENGITSIAWKEIKDSKYYMKYCVKDLEGEYYFRLRGTNKGLNEYYETDGNGNPLLDSLGQNTIERVTSDLWFYSNPIFVEPYSSSNTENKGFKSTESIDNTISENLNDVNIYPNPVTEGTLVIDNVDFYQKNVNITIISSTGVVLQSEQMTSPIIDVQQLPTGIYFLKLEMNNEVKVIRFLKN